MTDEHNASASQTFTVTLNGVNDAPVGVDDTGAATEKGGTNNGSPGSNATGNVLTNDTDVDDTHASLVVSAIRTGTEAGSGASGTVGSALTGAHGTLTLNSNGTYTYVVNDNDSVVQALNVSQSTTDTFTYTVKDPGALTDKAQLVITINGADDAPVVTPSPVGPILVYAGYDASADNSFVTITNTTGVAISNVILSGVGGVISSGVGSSAAAASHTIGNMAAGQSITYYFNQSGALVSDFDDHFSGAAKYTVSAVVNGGTVSTTFDPYTNASGGFVGFLGNASNGSETDNNVASTLVAQISTVTQYTEQASPVVIDSGLTVSDVDNANLAGATVTISGGFLAGDVLGFANVPATMGNIAFTSYTGGVLTLTSAGHTATLAQWQAALDSVTFANSTNDNPTDFGADTSRTISWVVNDGTLDSNIGTSTITVNAVNDAPVNAVPVAQSVNEDTNLVFTGANAITISDVDVGAGTEKVTLSVSSGALTLSGTSGLSFTVGDGTADPTMTFTGTVTNVNNALNGLIYRGVQDFNGSDTLTITTNDQGNTGSGGTLTDTDTVNVTVNAVADIVADTLSTNEDTAITANLITGTNGASADNFENAGRALTAVTQGTHGAVTFAANGNVTYTPTADYNGADSFTYTVTSGGVTETATVNVTVNAVADIVADTLSTNEDTAITANLITGTNGASADNFENAGRALTAVTQGTHGAVTFLANGNVTYTPTADYNGADSFTYTVTSGGVTETATVTVTVNAVADIVADTVTTNEDTPISFNPITGTNGSEADNFEGGSPQITQINGTAITAGGSAVAVTNGSVSLAVGNVLTFTPAADFNGVVPAFTYTVLSGGVSETANITVTVTAVADATNDALTTNEDTAVTANVLTGTGGATADNFEGAATLTSVTQGAHGAVTFLANGSVTYTPTADYNGADSFTYTATSGGVTETATVNVTVTAVADIANDSATTSEDTAVNILVQANDSFENAGHAITATGAASHGTVSINNNGTPGTTADDFLVYTPTADYNGADSFTYTVTSGGVTETATVNVTVNAVADIVADTVTTNEDTPISFNPITGTNGSEADNFEGGSPQITQINGTAITAGGSAVAVTNGSVSLAVGNVLTFTPAADFNGVVPAFTYTVLSGGVSETANITVTVTAVADIVADTVTTNEDTPISFNPITGTNGSEADNFEGGSPQITQINGTAITAGGSAVAVTNGSVSLAVGNVLTFTPAADFNGVVPAFTYTVLSGGVSETANITVTVTAVADIVADTVTTNEDTPISFNPITGTNGSEADNFEGGSPQITQINGTTITAGGSAVAVTNGSVSLAVGNVLTFTPAADFNGVVPAFTYTVLSGGVSETANITVTVTAVNDAPTVTTSGGTTAWHEATSITGSIWENDATGAANVTIANVPGTTPDVTFSLITSPNFPNATYSPNTIGAFLTAGGATVLTGTGTLGTTLDQSFYDFKGYVTVVNGQSFTVSSDDGATLVINGQTVINFPAPQSFTAHTATYTGVSGTFAFELVYGEQLGASGLVASLPLAHNAVVIDSGVTVADVDNATLASATVQITGGLQSAQDVLLFTNNGTTMGNIAGSYTAGTGVLALTSSGATATLAQWQAALQSVSYDDTAASPNTANRTISFVVNDGTSNSVVSTKTVSITADAAPVGTGDNIYTNASNAGSGTQLTVQNDWLLANDTDADNTILAQFKTATSGTNVVAKALFNARDDDL